MASSRPAAGPAGMPGSADGALVEALAALDATYADGTSSGDVADGSSGGDTPAYVDVELLWRIFDAQSTSRHLDAVARELHAAGRGFYTIGSAGHESNAAVAAALRPTDPALLHYRSGAFYLTRAAQVAGTTPVRDVLQGLMCAADESIAGGRHKVFGNAALSIIPQTSTIASHLPRAVGLAIALHRSHRLGAAAAVSDGHARPLPRPSSEDSPFRAWPDDAVVVCSFGDASANHSTATGAINTAINTAYRGLPMPLLLVCEDNGLGISVPTPSGWIEAAYGSRPGLYYLAADGADPTTVLRTATEAASYARDRRRPVFLHLKTVRFGGHAGSDAEISYRTHTEIAADYGHDPILGTARLLVASGHTTGAGLVDRYYARRADVDTVLAELGDIRTLGSTAEVMAPLAPRTPHRVAARATELAAPATFADELAAPPASSAEPRRTRPRSGSAEPDNQRDERPSTLAEAINATLAGALARDPRVIVFGEDVGRKGGVYGVTRGLQRRFGAARVFDTLLDEQSILGLGLGAGMAGLTPVPEIQYLAYLHNAEDQIRGEATTAQFFSQGQYRNPMVLRVAGLAYQKGFGGHFHNDNAVGVLRDVPGLVVACPARADDAAAMLRTCIAAAEVDGTVSAFVEPIALYHTRDLYDRGDGGWLAADTGQHVPIGKARSHGDQDGDHAGGPDLTIITFGNGVPMSLRVARRLTAYRVRARVVDLRWLAPLPVQDMVREAQATGRVLVVDETRHSGGVGEGVVAALVEAGFDGTLRRVASRDSFVPLGPAASHVLLSEEDIERVALELVKEDQAGLDAEEVNTARPPNVRARLRQRRKDRRR